MKAPPPFLLGLTLALWGWQTGWLWVGVALGAAIELPRWVRWHWELELGDFRQLWTITVLLFLGAFAYVFAAQEGMSAMTTFLGGSNFTQRTRAMETAARSVLIFFQWLPLVFYPLVIAQFYSGRAALPARLFMRLGRWKAAGKDQAAAEGGPALHLGYPYFGVCLLAASAVNEQRLWFFAALAPLMAYALWPARSPRYRPVVWASLWLVGAVLGAGVVAGLRGMSALANHLQTLWFSSPSGRALNSKESRTMIGQMGRAKGSGRIVMRVTVLSGNGGLPLLRETAYTIYRAETWQSAGTRRDFMPVYPETNETSWVFLEAPAHREVIISAYLEGGRGLLAVPHGLTRLDELPVFDLKTNHLGVLRVDVGPGLVEYRARSTEAATLDSAPDPTFDLDVPEVERPALAQVAAQLKLDELPLPQRVRAIESFFNLHFEYSLYQAMAAAQYTNQVHPTPLAWFLLQGRKGHCEYFATATVLLLRQAGIPARYINGWSVQESAGPGKYVIRGRHAHAWCIYWDAQARLWRELDTTPGTWLGLEENQRGWWEPVADAFSWLYWQFSRLRWGQGQLRQYVFWVLMAAVLLLAARFAWEARRRRRRQSGKADAAEALARAGLDSEFFAVEKRLAQMGLARAPHEPLTLWLQRIAPELPPDWPPWEPVVRLHYRLRFDPLSLSPDERARLRQESAALLDKLEAWRTRQGKPAGRRG
jgi:transglutaminase-like putative cysteine protease